ncbi:MAG: helix-turn-helix domain-containing protein [Lachnospiraceae bacterium]|jgi:transcriptional regulator with XRE-family HTH domain
MTFGEKIKEARLAMNLSQTELAQLTGISERSLYTYEQLGTLPRKNNIRKLAEALHISVSYLLDEDETDTQSQIDNDIFIMEAREKFGSKGAKEAQDVLGRVNSLFAGGDLDEEAKDVFFQAVMVVYMDSKKNAREKFTPKKYRKHKDKE